MAWYSQTFGRCFRCQTSKFSHLIWFQWQRLHKNLSRFTLWLCNSFPFNTIYVTHSSICLTMIAFVLEKKRNVKSSNLKWEVKNVSTTKIHSCSEFFFNLVPVCTQCTFPCLQYVWQSNISVFLFKKRSLKLTRVRRFLSYYVRSCVNSSSIGLTS